MPAGVAQGILNGMYLLQIGGRGKVRVTLFGSGTHPARGARGGGAARAGLRRAGGRVFGHQLQRTAHGTRWRSSAGICCIRPSRPGRPMCTRRSAGGEGPFVAATDYMKTVADQIRQWVPGRYAVLGTDGFGRSDSRAQLRRFFEVDRHYVVGRRAQGAGRRGQDRGAHGGEGDAGVRHRSRKTAIRLTVIGEQRGTLHSRSGSRHRRFQGRRASSTCWSRAASRSRRKRRSSPSRPKRRPWTCPRRPPDASRGQGQGGRQGVRRLADPAARDGRAAAAAARPPAPARRPPRHRLPLRRPRTIGRPCARCRCADSRPIGRAGVGPGGAHRSARRAGRGRRPGRRSTQRSTRRRSPRPMRAPRCASSRANWAPTSAGSAGTGPRGASRRTT